MKKFKIILMSGLLLIGSLSLAADPNLEHTEQGQGVNAPGAVGCAKCLENSKGGTLLDNENNTDAYTQLRKDTGAPADKAGTSDKGSN